MMPDYKLPSILKRVKPGAAPPQASPPLAPEASESVNASDSTRKRGRPTKPDALSDAERARRYRQKKRGDDVRT